MRYLKSYKIFESAKSELPPDFVYGVSDILLDMTDEGYSYNLSYYVENSWNKVTNLSQDTIDHLVNHNGVYSVGVDFPCRLPLPGVDADGYYEQIKKTMIRLFGYISDYPFIGYGLHFDGPGRSREQLFLRSHSDINKFVDRVKSNKEGIIELCLYQKLSKPGE